MCNTKTSLLKLAIFCIFVILMVIGGMSISSTNKENNAINELTSEQYVDLAKIASYKNINVGDANTVGEIIKLLPQPSVFHNQNMFSLQTDSEPYGLTVYYETNGYEGDSVPFWHSKMDNNALILFTFIDNLEHITFSSRDTPSNGALKPEEYNGIYKFSRADILNHFGELSKSKDDLVLLNNKLLENIKINDYDIHYNRVTFESTYDNVIYRDGEPNEIVKNADNSYVMIYENLGAGEYISSDGKTKEAIKGYDMTIFMDYGKVQGVYGMYIKGSSEILYNLGIENDLTYNGIIEKLGQPQILEGETIISYQLYNYPERVVSFYFDNDGNLEAHGFSSEPKAINITTTTTYTDENKTFSIELPKSWDNKYKTEVSDNTIIFYNIANNEANWGGELFRVNTITEDGWVKQKDDMTVLIGSHITNLGENNSKVYLLFTPSDVQYNVNDESLKKDYSDMWNNIEQIKSSFKLIDD